MPINNYTNNQNNINYKGANKLCKYSIRSLIASTSLFMLTTAIDTFKPEKEGKAVTALNTIASTLGIAGTAMGIFGIEKIDEKDENR